MVLELFVSDLFSSKSQLFQDVSGLHGWGGQTGRSQRRCVHSCGFPVWLTPPLPKTACLLYMGKVY